MARDSAEHLSDETGRQLSRMEKQLKETQEALSQSSHEVCWLHVIQSLPSACLMCCCTKHLGQHAELSQIWMPICKITRSEHILQGNRSAQWWAVSALCPVVDVSFTACTYLAHHELESIIVIIIVIIVVIIVIMLLCIENHYHCYYYCLAVWGVNDTPKTTHIPA